MWKQCIAEHAASGDPLDVMPVPIPGPPPSENFLRTPALEQIMSGKAKLPYILAPIHLGGWSYGEFGDLKGIARGIQQSLKQEWTPETSTAAIIRHALEPFDTICNEVRNSALARPYSQFARPALKTAKDIFTSKDIHFDVTIQFSRILILNACLNRAEGNMENSYADTLAGLKLATGLLTESRTILETMVGSAILNWNIQPVWEGCQQHAWSTEQLAGFQKQFEKCQVMSSLQSAFVNERNVISQLDLAEAERLADKPRRLVEIFASLVGAHNKVSYVHGIDQYIDIIGAHSKPDFASRVRQLQYPRPSMSPYRILEQLVVNNFKPIMIESIEGANSQTLALTACALERHWLAHSSYPEHIAELVPTYLSKLPRDIIDGQPLRYRRTDGGKFVLYSIGLDGKDDGGKPTDSKQTDGSGDWVWPQLATANP